jgi:hypothetical protein
MQNRYTGDIGDFLKLGILRALSPGYLLGVGWWLYPDEAHNDDGRHIGYLRQPEQWRRFDPALFDALSEIVTSCQRNVRALEAANILAGAIFANMAVPTNGPNAQRHQSRHAWFETVQRALDGADLVFVDQDNGMEPAGATATIPPRPARAFCSASYGRFTGAWPGRLERPVCQSKSDGTASQHPETEQPYAQQYQRCRLRNGIALVDQQNLRCSRRVRNIGERYRS